MDWRRGRGCFLGTRAFDSVMLGRFTLGDVSSEGTGFRQFARQVFYHEL